MRITNLGTEKTLVYVHIFFFLKHYFPRKETILFILFVTCFLMLPDLLHFSVYNNSLSKLIQLNSFRCNLFADDFQSYGFPHSSVGKESACNAGDPGLTPGLGRSAGEGRGYPLQYSWASLVAQLVKNLPAMQETWVWSLGWEDRLEKRKATHSSILAWRIPWTV